MTIELSRRRLLATAAVASVMGARGAFAADTVSIKRRYVDCRYGQLHLHVAEPAAAKAATRNPILCMHPSPASGRYYLDLLRDLGRDRIAMASDTPGYGESDRPPAPAPMEGYSGAMADALENLGYGDKAGGRKVDLLGYHTGCLIAVDLAIRRPDLIRRLCLVAVPYYGTAERREQLLANLDRAPYGEEPTKIVEMWDGTVKRRAKGVSLEQSIDQFLERMRPGDKEWWAYEAVFSYDSPARFPLITQPTALLNPHGVLYKETLAAAPMIKGAKLVDLPELTHGVFQVGTAVIAREARKFLDA
ncbi:MAG: alpha/beta hydrolase [Rhodospirillaceae bacterium]|nr:alpha/beta hydrolase [Rhodospirillaceae bacterium]